MERTAMTAEECCLIVHAEIRRITGERVAFGPFAGMWMGGARQYYLLGTYELELHPVISGLLERRFRTIVNVGAGVGYYAVGLGVQHPEARVIAFELDERALGYLATVARENGIGDRFEVRGACFPIHLKEAVGDGDACLVVMDCEGAEGVLLNPDAVPGLRRSHILVELHEFIDESIADVIRRRFCGSHDISETWARPRTFADLPFVPNPEACTDELRPYYVYTIDENRPTDMRWFLMEPK